MPDKEDTTVDDTKASGIKIDKVSGEGSGIKITPTKGELPPPLEAGAEPPPAEEIKAERVTGKIPISPAVIKPPLRFEGLALSEITGYPGFIYSEEDLEDIALLIQECGLEADPKIQVLIALLGLHAAKFTGYMAWKRTGRPGDLKKASDTGEVERIKRPPEEKVIA